MTIQTGGPFGPYKMKATTSELPYNRFEDARDEMLAIQIVATYFRNTNPTSSFSEHTDKARGEYVASTGLKSPIGTNIIEVKSGQRLDDRDFTATMELDFNNNAGLINSTPKREATYHFSIDNDENLKLSQPGYPSITILDIDKAERLLEDGKLDQAFEDAFEKLKKLQQAEHEKSSRKVLQEKG